MMRVHTPDKSGPNSLLKKLISYDPMTYKKVSMIQ